MQKLLKPTTDPAYDILRSERQPLHAIFLPETVAVIGATDRVDSIGRTLLGNLLSHPFGGMIFPVNPQQESILGLQAYPNLTAVPDPIELAIVATPAPTVPGIVRECVEAGVKGAIIISAGFQEIGGAGLELEQQIRNIAQGRMRIIGPNCLGVMNPQIGLNATLASAMARPGPVGFISQSAALCTSVLDWSLQENVGFSALISLGGMLDVDWGDLIYYLGDDPHTHSIVIHMESVGNARSFLSAAREVALTKPIIAIKANSDEVFQAACRRCGILRVDRLSELFNMVEGLAKQPRPLSRPRLTAIASAGGADLMQRYSYNLKGIYETPTLPPEGDASPDRALAEQLIQSVRQSGRTVLTELESKRLLAAYGVPAAETTIGEGKKEGAGAIPPMPIPEGGRPLRIGSRIDSQFGPVLLFGTGGQLVGRDLAIAIPPLNTTLARRMMEQAEIYQALPEVYPALEQLLVRFSQLVVEQPQIKEIEIDPLLAFSPGASHVPLLALDARIALHPEDVLQEQLPKPAIRPYPIQYVAPWRMSDGTPVTIRPIRPEDEPLMAQFHQALSEESVYFRYFHLMTLSRRIAHERLSRICFIDYDREIALVADCQEPETGKHEILAICRLSKLQGIDEAEFALLVSDPYQRRGLGTELLRRLVQIGRDEQLDRITADMLPENLAMQRVAEKVGFRLYRDLDLVRAAIDL